jgi:putative transposase
MRYRRARVKGGTYFFTVVTNRRIKIFKKPHKVQLLREAFKYIMDRHPFKIDAFVLLPDHLHCIWTLPCGDANYSTRWRLIKSYFSRKFDSVGWVDEGNPTPRINTASRFKKKEKLIWQRRFWEHLIRDDRDFKRHVEYIHFNPVKHGLAASPKDWLNSSFHRYVNEGIYDLEWGAGTAIEFDESVGYE